MYKHLQNDFCQFNLHCLIVLRITIITIAKYTPNLGSQRKHTDNTKIEKKKQ